MTRMNAVMPGHFENRHWLFCPVCGKPRAENDGRPLPELLLPSMLLRLRWTRLSAAGRLTLPCSDWSLLGAGNMALDAGSERWLAWFGHVREILTERHGGVGIQRFNRDPMRSREEVIAVAVEAERRAGIGFPKA